MTQKLLYDLLLKKKNKFSISNTTKKYPYFLIPRILYLSKLKLNSKKFQNYLNHVSLYTTERSFLRKKINKIKSGNNENQKQIVENFISKNRKIKKNSTNNNDLEKDLINSKKKIKNIITENMAKIYISQNKLNEGIKIYKKLMIKFPKKRTYFAEEIKKIKKNIYV